MSVAMDMQTAIEELLEMMYSAMTKSVQSVVARRP
jgi:hypothetical protein